MSTPLRQNLTFPVGRLIGGSVAKFRDKDRSGKLLTTKDGQPRKEWSFGVAFEKNGTQAFWQTEWGAIAYSIARNSFPQLFKPDGSLADGRTFSFKVTDGDSQTFNTEGKRPCDTPEWRNCWVVWFKSQFPPTTWSADGSTAIPPEAIKCGNFVQVAGSIDSNGDAGKPGVYMNHSMVALSGYHPDGEISSGPDAGAVGFGKGALPANMQQVPAGALPQMPQQPQYPGQAGHGYAPSVAPPQTPYPGTPAAPPQYAPPAPSLPPQAPQMGVHPHPGIMVPPGGAPTYSTPQYASGAPMMIPPPPPPPPPPPIPAAPVGPVATAKAGGATWAQLQAGGWTEDVARAHGVIV